MAQVYAYIGNWKPVEGSGMAVCRYDEAAGRLTYLRNELEEMHIYIGCICLNRAKGILYCTDERPDHPELRSGGGGRVFAFSISSGDGSLKLINSQPSFGSKPSYVTADDNFNYLAVTNHGGRTCATVTEQDAFGNYHLKVWRDESSLVLFPLKEDGSIGLPADIKRLTGTGPKFFQQSAHAHSVQKAPGRNFFVVCDKGGDQLHTFCIDYNQKKLVRLNEPCKSLPGTAPRYCAFHPSKPWLYVNHESEAVVSQYLYDCHGALELVDSVPTLPAGIEPPPYDALCQSDICINRQGTRLYDMLRIVNIIQVYEINPENGRVKLIQTFSTPDGGRSFTLSPDGHFLTVAYTDGGHADSYRLDDCGKIEEAVSVLHQPKPSCIAFYSIP